MRAVRLANHKSITISGELPEHACNGLTSDDPNGCSGCANTGHKWLDFNRGDLVMAFNSPTAVASWDWQTANDAPARDPTKWTLEGSNDGDSWTVLDNTWATSAFATTAARYTWQGPFQVTNFCIPTDPDFTATFYFGQQLPTAASADAILDDGTGFAVNRDGGLSYGWDCEVRFLTEILESFRRFVDEIWRF